MIHVDKHAMSRESSSKKSPFPEKFQEPDNMISVELNTFADNAADCKFLNLIILNLIFDHL